MAIETHKKFPCENCDSIKYKNRDGLWICVVCKAENTDIIVEEFDDDPNVSKYRMTATVTRAETKTDVEASFIRNPDQGNRPWLTIEALQQILRCKALAICRELELRESESQKVLVLLREMWFTYLKARLLCFTSESNPINFRDRDLHMYRAIKNDGFNGFEKTSYDPMQYKKTPKDVDMGIYSAGNTTHFEFTSSDSEPDAQVSLNRTKKLKKKKKKATRKFQRVSLADIQSILFLGFRVLGYPIPFKSIFKHCIIDEIKNYLPSHMKPTSVDLFLKRLVFNITDETIESRNKLHRETLSFVHHHIAPPFSKMLSQLDSKAARGQLLVREMKSKLCELELPDCFCKIVNQFLPHFLRKIESLHESKLEIFMPFIDVWVQAIIYIVMVSAEADDQLAWLAWCNGWRARRESKEDLLSDTITVILDEARITNCTQIYQNREKENYQMVQQMPTIEKTKRQEEIHKIDASFSAKLNLPHVELNPRLRALIYSFLPSKVDLESYAKFDKRHVIKESYNYYRFFIRHLRNEENHSRFKTFFDGKTFVAKHITSNKKTKTRKTWSYEHKLPLPGYLDTFAQLAAISKEQFIATVLFLLE